MNNKNLAIFFMVFKCQICVMKLKKEDFSNC